MMPSTIVDLLRELIGVSAQQRVTELEVESRTAAEHG
jgi:hypothetical protein